MSSKRTKEFLNEDAQFGNFISGDEAMEYFVGPVMDVFNVAKIALKDIGNNKIEIYLKDTNSNPNQTIKSAMEFKEMGIRIIIGPVFYKSLAYLSDINDVIFLSFTNKTLNLPKNVISAGVNATSQLNTIKKFIESKEIKKTILLTHKLNYEDEIKKAIQL